MTSVPSTAGTQHTDTPTGSEQQIHGLPTYVAVGHGNDTNPGIVVIISNMFGWTLPNARLLADRFAHATGATVYVPDFLSGDPMPHEFLDQLGPSDPALSFFEKAKHNVRRAQAVGPWLLRHREAVSWPIVNGFFEALYREAPARTVCAAGYSWGGRYAVLLTHRSRWVLSDQETFREGGLVACAFAATPALLAVPKEVAAIARPVAFALGDCDEMLSMASVSHLQAALRGDDDKQKAVETEVVVYNGGTNGFALRGDLAQQRDKELFDSAAQQAIGWFRRFLD